MAGLVEGGLPSGSASRSNKTRNGRTHVETQVDGSHAAYALPGNVGIAPPRLNACERST
jgi:hypothetical protein